MQIITKQLATSIPYQFSFHKSRNAVPGNKESALLLPAAKEDFLFLDIETTGFSPDVTSIYLIGCCYYQNNFWQLIQWFADDYISEEQMLQSFIDFSKNFKVLIHFNGLGFDIPYMQKKMAHYKIDFNFSTFLQIDLYKRIFPYKKVLGLPNLKQKTIEHFLGISRTDNYSGKELINVYVTFMKDKFSGCENMHKEQNTLLLHNEEDVCHLISLTSILAYCDLFEEKPNVINMFYEDGAVTITFSLQNGVKKEVFYKDDFIILQVKEKVGQLHVTCLTGVLKYFYPNYKDYYYLTLEDTAIHKSVAEFVDKNYRIKAKAANCYTKKEGIFIPQFHGDLKPAFRKEYKAKESFLEVSEKLITNHKACSAYAEILIQHILHVCSNH